MRKKQTKKSTPKKISAKKKGTMLETEIKKIARKNKCKVVSNIFIGYKSRDKKQRYIEVDVAILSEKGLIVVEAKNYSCKISGSVNDIYVKTTYPSGKIFSIYNPITQNKSHIKQVKNYLDVTSVYSFIVFSDETDIQFTDKQHLGNDVKLMNISDLESNLQKILNNNDNQFTTAKVNSLHSKLSKRANVSPIVKARHKSYVKKLKSN